MCETSNLNLFAKIVASQFPNHFLAFCLGMRPIFQIPNVDGNTHHLIGLREYSDFQSHDQFNRRGAEVMDVNSGAIRVPESNESQSASSSENRTEIIRHSPNPNTWRTSGRPNNFSGAATPNPNVPCKT